MSILPLLVPGDTAYDERLRKLADRGTSIPTEIVESVRAILADVRARGDAAVIDYERKFAAEPKAVNDTTLEIEPRAWSQRTNGIAPDILQALERAKQRIANFHEPQQQAGYVMEHNGVRLELRSSAMQRVGLYVPGGTAAYPSSVLMTAIPAAIAGVHEIIMVTPRATPETLAAARLAGVHRVFEMGGAQAVAALAYGTQTVPRVDKIVGPGNMYVAEAKRQVFGEVAIDTIAGPSEVLCIADDTATPAFVAADLIAQAEHDVQAIPLLVTTSEAMAAQIKRETEKQLVGLPRKTIAEQSLSEHGIAIVVVDLDAAVTLANRLAPEHLELHIADAAALAHRFTTAGAIFIGGLSPEATGDYMAGPNHVLPTNGAARFSSPLGVYDFIKRTSIIEYGRDGLIGQAADISRLARVEGLDGHARSVGVRLSPPEDS